VVESRKLQLPIDEVYKFDEIGTAFEHVEADKHLGKIVGRREAIAAGTWCSAASDSIAFPSLFAALERSLYFQQGLLKGWQVVLYRLPNDLAVNALILMPKDIADAGDVLPTNFLVRRLQLAGKMAAGLGNDFNPALHC
jgi:hypothetical protein